MAQLQDFNFENVTYSYNQRLTFPILVGNGYHYFSKEQLEDLCEKYNYEYSRINDFRLKIEPLNDGYTMVEMFEEFETEYRLDKEIIDGLTYYGIPYDVWEHKYL